MKKILLFILFLFSQFGFSQSEKDDYEIYSLVLTEQLEFGINNKVDSILLVEKSIEKANIDYEIFDSKSDTLAKWEINTIYSLTNRDDLFVKRLGSDSEYLKTIKELIVDFKNNPKINSDFLTTENIFYKTISLKKYSSLIGKKRYKKNAWKRIERKYKVQHIIEFSKINYNNNLAAVYYSHNCGDLCGQGNIVIFEKNNGEWKITTLINLWMS